MYKIVMFCRGVPEQLGPQAALDITEEFKFRTWHERALCLWDGFLLKLQVENDFDDNGLATQGEFSDAISACVSGDFAGDIVIEQISEY